MNEIRCVIVGGGYAEIHAAKSILNNYPAKLRSRLRLTMIDQHRYHLRKVLLFKAAAGDADITIPLQELFPEKIEFVHGKGCHSHPQLQSGAGAGRQAVVVEW